MFAECLSLSSGYGHIKNVISGVRYFHHTMGHTFPTDSVPLDDTLQGLKRKLKGTPKQVLPIGPVILRRMFKNVNLKKNLDLAHWCGCLIAFYTLFRKANLCPKEKSFDPETLLTRGDILLDKVDKRVLIFVNFAKNNQFQKQCHVATKTPPWTCILTSVNCLHVLMQMKMHRPCQVLPIPSSHTEPSQPDSSS